MYRILIACRFGVGTSMVLKVKLQEVVNENNYPITIEHSNLDSITAFDGDAIFTVVDVAKEMSEKYPKIHFYGIKTIIDKVEMKAAIDAFLEMKKEQNRERGNLWTY